MLNRHLPIAPKATPRLAKHSIMPSGVSSWNASCHVISAAHARDQYQPAMPQVTLFLPVFHLLVRPALSASPGLVWLGGTSMHTPRLKLAGALKYGDVSAIHSRSRRPCLKPVLHGKASVLCQLCFTGDYILELTIGHCALVHWECSSFYLRRTESDERVYSIPRCSQAATESKDPPFSVVRA